MNLTRMNIVLFVMAAGLAVPTWLTIQRDRTDFTSYEEIPKLFAGFTPGTVTAIAIGRATVGADGEAERSEEGELLIDWLQLLRVAEGWVIGDGELAGVGVAGNQIQEKVFDHLDRIRVDQQTLERSAASAQELREFGLAEDQALHLFCFDQQRRPVARLLIGNDASGGEAGEAVVRGFYVRDAESSDVVLYEQAYWQLGTDAEQWIERRPLQLNIADIVGLRLDNPKGSMELARDPQGAEWRAVEAPGSVGAVRNGEVRAFVETVSSLTVQRYVQRLPAEGPQRDAILAGFGLGEPRISLVLSMADGTTYRFAVGDQLSGKNEYYLRLSSLDFVLAVGDWITSPLTRDPTLFFDPPASRVSEEPPEVPAEPGQKDGEGQAPVEPPATDGQEDAADEDTGDEDVGDEDNEAAEERAPIDESGEEAAEQASTADTPDPAAKPREQGADDASEVETPAEVPAADERDPDAETAKDR